MADGAGAGAGVGVQHLHAELAKLKKELAAKVRHYEGKLVTLTVINGALQTENEALKEELATVSSSSASASSSSAAVASTAAAEQELKELHAEFTKRLGAAEKSAHAFKEECFSLRRQVEELKKAKEKSEEDVAERDASLEQYKQEGERLAKRVGEVEATVGRLRGENSKVEQEKEKLQARVQVLEAAAQSVDKSRSAALEDSQQELAALQHSLQEQKDHFTKVIEELRVEKEREARRHGERLKQERQSAAKELEERERMVASRALALEQSLTQSDKEHCSIQDRLRQEIQRLEWRCRAAEAAQEEAQASLSETTQPLIRRMEALSGETKRLEGEVRERERQIQVERDSAEQRVRAEADQRRKAERAAQMAKRRAEDAEAGVNRCQEEAQAAESRALAAERECESVRVQWVEAVERANCAEAGHREAMEALSNARVGKEEAQVRISVLSLEMEQLQLQISSLQSPHHRALHSHGSGLPNGDGPGVGRSATGEDEGKPRDGAGAARQSSGEAHGSSEGVPWKGGDVHPPGVPGVPWKGTPGEVHLEEGSSDSQSRGSAGESGQGDSRPSWAHSRAAADGRKPAGVGMEGAEGVPSSAAVVVERLSSKLRQQQGEMEQLQKGLRAANAAKEHCEGELLRVSQRLLALEKSVGKTPELERELAELRKRHEMALVIIGERNERVEELEADMADVKSMYREQVNLLVNQVDPDKWPNGYRICLFCPHCAQGQRGRAK